MWWNASEPGGRYCCHTSRNSKAERTQWLPSEIQLRTFAYRATKPLIKIYKQKNQDTHVYRSIRVGCFCPRLRGGCLRNYDAKGDAKKKNPFEYILGTVRTRKRTKSNSFSDADRGGICWSV
jgi:hypothetical protein